MFEEADRINEINGQIEELVEYARGNGEYLAIREIARFILDQVNDHASLLNAFISGKRDLSDPVLLAYLNLLLFIDQKRKELNVPFNEFLEDIYPNIYNL